MAKRSQSESATFGLGGALFLTLMVAGLVGLLMMALPALGGHGHPQVAHGGHLGVRGGGAAPRLWGGRTAGGGRTAMMAGTAALADRVPVAAPPADSLARAVARLLRWLPTPRAVCSLMALYGAFGNALIHAAHMGLGSAALVAVAPAVLVELLVVRPIWNLLFRFQGQPSSPLDALLLCEGRAVVPFRNGRGIVSVVRDGRVVQLVATLRDDHAAFPVNVGDPVRIEDVDAQRERVTVSVVTYREKQ